MELPGRRKKRKTSNKIDGGREGLCDRRGCEEIRCSEPWKKRTLKFRSAKFKLGFLYERRHKTFDSTSQLSVTARRHSYHEEPACARVLPHRRVITCVCLSVSDENANLGTAMRYEEIGEWGLQCVDLSGLVCRVLWFSFPLCLFVCLFVSGKHDVY